MQAPQGFDATHGGELFPIKALMRSTEADLFSVDESRTTPTLLDLE
jgi:hypothetical protein